MRLAILYALLFVGCAVASSDSDLYVFSMVRFRSTDELGYTGWFYETLDTPEVYIYHNDFEHFHSLANKAPYYGDWKYLEINAKSVSSAEWEEASFYDYFPEIPLTPGTTLGMIIPAYGEPAFPYTDRMELIFSTWIRTEWYQPIFSHKCRSDNPADCDGIIGEDDVSDLYLEEGLWACKVGAPTGAGTTNPTWLHPDTLSDFHTFTYDYIESYNSFMPFNARALVTDVTLAMDQKLYCRMTVPAPTMADVVMDTGCTFAPFLATDTKLHPITEVMNFDGWLTIYPPFDFSFFGQDVYALSISPMGMIRFDDAPVTFDTWYNYVNRRIGLEYSDEKYWFSDESDFTSYYDFSESLMFPFRYDFYWDDPYSFASYNDWYSYSYDYTPELVASSFWDYHSMYCETGCDYPGYWGWEKDTLGVWQETFMYINDKEVGDWVYGSYQWERPVHYDTGANVGYDWPEWVYWNTYVAANGGMWHEWYSNMPVFNAGDWDSATEIAPTQFCVLNAFTTWLDANIEDDDGYVYIRYGVAENTAFVVELEDIPLGGGVCTAPGMGVTLQIHIFPDTNTQSRIEIHYMQTDLPVERFRFEDVEPSRGTDSFSDSYYQYWNLRKDMQMPIVGAISCDGVFGGRMAMDQFPTSVPGSETCIQIVGCLNGYMGEDGQCQCAERFYLDETAEGRSCVPCPPQTYKNWVGNEECIPCPSNSVMPDNVYGMDDNSECECEFEYGGNAAVLPLDMDMRVCQECAGLHDDKRFHGNRDCGCDSSTYASTVPAGHGSCTCPCGRVGHGFRPSTSQITDVDYSCAQCPLNFYKSWIGNSEDATLDCLPCPEPSANIPGTGKGPATGERCTCTCATYATWSACGEWDCDHSEDTCTCTAGYYWDFEKSQTACQACIADTYKPAAGNDIAGCLPCEDFLPRSTTDGVTHVTTSAGCKCPADYGYIGDEENGHGCYLCDTEQTNKKSPNSWNLNPCVCKDTNASPYLGPDEIIHCRCNPGFYWDEETEKCIACADGTYKAEYGNDQAMCMSCAQGSGPQAESFGAGNLKTHCWCPSGSFYTAPNVCEVCPLDTYLDSTCALNKNPANNEFHADSVKGCKACPSGIIDGFEWASTTLDAADVENRDNYDDCHCPDGMYRTGGTGCNAGTCAECGPNEYHDAEADFEDDEECTPCPDGMYSSYLQNSEEDCYCDLYEFLDNDGTCAECDDEEFTVSYNRFSSCQTCEGNVNPDMRYDTEDDCIYGASVGVEFSETHDSDHVRLRHWREFYGLGEGSSAEHYDQVKGLTYTQVPNADLLYDGDYQGFYTQFFLDFEYLADAVTLAHEITLYLGGYFGVAVEYSHSGHGSDFIITGMDCDGAYYEDYFPSWYVWDDEQPVVSYAYNSAHDIFVIAVTGYWRFYDFYSTGDAAEMMTLYFMVYQDPEISAIDVFVHNYPDMCDYCAPKFLDEVHEYNKFLDFYGPHYYPETSGNMGEEWGHPIDVFYDIFHFASEYGEYDPKELYDSYAIRFDLVYCAPCHCVDDSMFFYRDWTDYYGPGTGCFCNNCYERNGDECIACSAGEELVDGSCQACIDNVFLLYSEMATTDSDACSCTCDTSKGLVGADDFPFCECPVCQEWKVDSNQCDWPSTSACPFNSYIDPDSLECNECPDTDMITVGVNSCGVESCLCPEDTYFDGSECVDCPMNSGTGVDIGRTSIEDCYCEDYHREITLVEGDYRCVCSPGWTLANTDYDQDTSSDIFCHQCHAGRFKPDYGNQACDWCPPGTYADQFSDPWECISCPEGSTTSVDMGADNIRYCDVCRKGFGYDGDWTWTWTWTDDTWTEELYFDFDQYSSYYYPWFSDLSSLPYQDFYMSLGKTNRCFECQPDTYNDEDDHQDLCTMCGPNSGHDFYREFSPDECGCEIGYGLDEDECVECDEDAGEYKNYRGNAPCWKCDENDHVASSSYDIKLLPGDGQAQFTLLTTPADVMNFKYCQYPVYYAPLFSDGSGTFKGVANFKWMSVYAVHKNVLVFAIEDDEYECGPEWYGMVFYDVGLLFGYSIDMETIRIRYTSQPDTFTLQVFFDFEGIVTADNEGNVVDVQLRKTADANIGGQRMYITVARVSDLTVPVLAMFEAYPHHEGDNDGYWPSQATQTVPAGYEECNLLSYYRGYWNSWNNQEWWDLYLCEMPWWNTVAAKVAESANGRLQYMVDFDAGTAECYHPTCESNPAGQQVGEWSGDWEDPYSTCEDPTPCPSDMTGAGVEIGCACKWNHVLKASRIHSSTWDFDPESAEESNCECGPGTYLGATWNAACVSCPAETIKLVQGNEEDLCKPCPPGSKWKGGKSGIQNCECVADATHALYDANNPYDTWCVECPANSHTLEGWDATGAWPWPYVDTSKTYAAGVDENAYIYAAHYDCVCDEWFASFDDPTSLDRQCVCNPGFFGEAADPYVGPEGPRCSECPKNTFTFPDPAGNTLEERCKPCPDNAVTRFTAADSIEDCFCPPTYGGRANLEENCVRCDGGWQDEYANKVCQCADPLAVAQPGICECPAGYSGDARWAAADGSESMESDDLEVVAPCTLCAINTYKETISNGDCTPCPLHSQNDAEGSTINDCYCIADHYGDPATEVACQLCPLGTKEAGNGGLIDCVCKTEVENGDDNCNCNAGYGYVYDEETDTDSCTACPVDTYKNTVNLDACTPCWAGSVTDGKTAQTTCLCDEDFEPGTEANTCTPCKTGYHKNSVGNTDCVEDADSSNTTTDSNTSGSGDNSESGSDVAAAVIPSILAVVLTLALLL